ncbi:MAG: glutamine synthetase family protein, partial [Halofilum sp. (in: g-proteobacteria)]|nr:glutamine synthetase family protein [Halofilum sp. (in: g-proteobacteria)]
MKEWFDERGITEVECLVPDMTGTPKGKIMPAGKYLGAGWPRLPDSIFIQTAAGDYPEDEASFWNPIEQDMELVADVDSLRLVPWVSEPTAQIIHDCRYLDGQPVELSPRYVLRRVLELFHERGLEPVVAPEVEFFLVKKNVDPDYPLEAPVGRSGRQGVAHQSYSIDALNEFDPLFEQMYDYCEAMDLDIDTLVQEEGSGQMEINFQHGSALELADQVFLFKRALREVAFEWDIYATFMAKPMQEEPGSSLHIHQSLRDIDSGRNAFADASGEPSELFRNYIGGLQNYLPAALAFLAPNVNSYRRLMPGNLAAPINVEWGHENRTVGLRVPHARAEGTRIESRVAGADANPYLAMAATLASGYLGIVHGSEPRPPTSQVGNEAGQTLASELSRALDELQACSELHELLGERFTAAYLAAKRAEYSAYFRVISS